MDNYKNPRTIKNGKIKWSIKYFFLLILLTSCSNAPKGEVKKENEIQVDRKTQLLSEVNRIKNKYSSNNNSNIADSLLQKYAISDYYEIRIAYRLYEFRNNDVPGDIYDEYLVDRTLYKRLFDEMFPFEKNLNKIKNKIEANSVRYLDENRSIVFQSYYRYHGLRSKEFYSLLLIKDTFLTKIVDAYMKDSLVDNEEREEVVQSIKKYYPDLLGSDSIKSK